MRFERVWKEPNSKREETWKRGNVAQQSHPWFFFLAAWPQEAQPLEVTGVVGGVAFLNSHTSPNPSKYSQIHWRWENQVKIAIQRRGEKAEYPKGLFKGRLELFENYTLKISHLGIGDSSEYQLYLEDNSGKETIETVLLKVYGEFGDRELSHSSTGGSGTL